MLLKSYEEDINKFQQGALTIIISWGVLQGQAVKHEKNLNFLSFSAPESLLAGRQSMSILITVITRTTDDRKQFSAMPKYSRNNKTGLLLFRIQLM